MNKRVLSFFISIFLIFYSLVPVYAVDETTTLNNETVEESTEDTEISVFSDFENVDKQTDSIQKGSYIDNPFVCCSCFYS